MKHSLTIVLLCICLFSVAQTDTLHWHKMSPLPSFARTDFSYFVIDSFFYVIGGDDSDLNYQREVWRYNIPADQWQRMRDFPQYIAVMTSFSLNGKGYVGVGLDSAANGYCDPKIWEYDPSADSWTRKRDFLGSPREITPLSTFTYNGKAYFGMGFQCLNALYLRDIWQYDPIADSTTLVTNIPSATRFCSSAAVVDSFAYIVGGYNENAVHQDFWRYNILANKWTRMANLPLNGRSNSMIWGLGKTIVIGYGGTEDSSFNRYLLANNIWRFDLSDSTWHRLTSLNFLDSVDGGAAFTYGNRAYFFGGLRNFDVQFNYYKDMWYFDASELIKTGIEEVTNVEPEIKLFPQPLKVGEPLRIQSSERGSIGLYNTLGQQLYSGSLLGGLNVIPADQLELSSGMIFYHASLSGGAVFKGKVLSIR